MKPAALLSLLLASAAPAAPTRFFTLDTPQSLAGARSQGVVVRSDGGLAALPPLAALARFQEPLAQALATDGRGNFYVGTGHPARVYQVNAGGSKLLAELAADQVTSLLLAPDGTLFATTALPGSVVRLSAGKVETLASLPEGNFWDSAWFGGRVVLAAGNPGRLYALGPKGLEQLQELPDRHGRCLAVSGDKLYIGTSGKGLILAYDGSRLGVLYDSAFTEIASLAVGGDGAVYAVGVFGDPTLGQRPGEGQATVTTSTGAPSPETGRFTSEVLRVTPQGAVTTLYRFEKELASTLAWAGDVLLLGTSLEGKLLQLTQGALAELDTVDAGQITKLAPGGQALLTQGPVQLLLRQGQARGSFTSPALDAGQPSQWGSFSGSFQGPCQVSFRSGNTKEVGEAWSPWSPPVPCGNVAVNAPQGRFLQLKLELGPGPAEVTRILVAYRQLNLAPQIAELKVYPPGEVYLKAPPPSERIVELTHPELSGIFTTLEEEKDTQTQLGKKYYRVGFQTVSWKAEDPNGDPLLFKLEIQRQGGAWWVVRENLESVQLALDTQALPDGVYRFRLTASDAPGNPEDPATASAVSSWFVVDNTPPEVRIRREGAFWVVEAEDALSPILLAQWNRDAQRWEPLAPADGLLDSPKERFRLPVQPGQHLFSVRVVDDHHNRRVVAVEEKP